LNSKLALFLEAQARLHMAIHQRRLELWPDNWILRHDSTSAHKRLAVGHSAQKKIRQFAIFAMFIPWVLQLFPKQSLIKDDKCSDIVDILGCVSNILRSFKKTSSSSVLNSGNVKSPNMLCKDANSEGDRHC
jgi:hypothetical protein